MKKSYSWSCRFFASLLVLAIAVPYSVTPAFADEPAPPSPATVSSVTPPADSILSTNYKVFIIKFSGAMNGSTLTANNVKLRYNTSDYISGTVTYNAPEYYLYFVATESLPPNTTFHLELTDAVEDDNSPHNAVGPYSVQYTTTTDADVTLPTVVTTVPTNNSTSVDPATNDISITFDKQLDPTTIDSSSWSSLPTISATTSYDPVTKSIVLGIDDASSLQAGTAYQFTFNSAVIKDASGNAPSADSVLNFTTATEPSITSVEFNTSGFEIVFDSQMTISTVTAFENYNLSCDSSSIDLSKASFYWDSFDKTISVSGSSITLGATCTLELSTNIKSDANIALAAGSLTHTGASVAGQSSGNTDATGQMWNPVNAWPSAYVAGLTTDYYFSFPITSTLSDGDKIDITFPAGFDASGVTYSSFWSNNDINGYQANTAKISASEFNADTRTITLTLDIDGTGTIGTTTENLYFTLGNIVNPSVGAWTLNFTTKEASGEIIERPSNFNPISIIEPGTGTATIHVLTTGSDLPIPGAIVNFYNWQIGIQPKVTDENGDASITGVPVDSGWGSDVYASLDGMNVPDGYKPNWTSQNIHLTTDTPSNSSTMYLDAANLRISGTITHPGIGADGATMVTVRASGSSWTNKNVTLDPSGSTDYTLYLADAGSYNVGIDKYYDPNGGGYDANSNFVPPRSVQQTLSLSNTAENPLNVNFSLEIADKAIQINVRDQDGVAIPQAWCSVTSDHAKSNTDSSDGSMATGGTAADMGDTFWAGTQSNSEGVCNINVRAGRYRVDVYAQGMSGQMGIPVKVTSTDSTVEVDFVIKKPTISISGSVSDLEGTGIQYANVNCFDRDNAGNAYANTDSNGEYVLLVNAGTWTCNTWAPNYGFVPAATGVDATDFAVTGDIENLNFVYDPSAFANITGIVLDALGAPKTYTWLWADKVNTTTKQYGGYGNGASTDGTGAFSVQVPKNDANESYNLTMWDSVLGGQFIVGSNIDTSGGNVDLGTVSLPTTYDVEVNIVSMPGDVSTTYANIQNTDIHSWTWTDVSLSSGTGSKTIQLPDGHYTAHLQVPGYGERKTDFEVNGGEASVDFDFSGLSFDTYTVTVNDATGAVENVYVEAFDSTSGAYSSNFTDSDGVATLTVYSSENSSYVIRANDMNHVSGMIPSQSGVTEYTITLASADSSISGTVTDGDGTAVEYAWVDAITTDGASWVGTSSDGSGNFDIAVPVGTTWNLEVHSPNGIYGAANNVTAGTSGVMLAMDQTLDFFIKSDPVSVTINPAIANTVSSPDVDLSIPAGALGSDTNGVTITITKTAAVANTGTTNPLGNFGIDISATDSNGNKITNLNSVVTIQLKYHKDQIETLLQNGSVTVDAFNHPLGYFNDVNGVWPTTDGATISVQAQENSGDEYQTVSIEDFITNYDDTYSDYADYIVVYTANTDHFTIFAPIVGDPQEEDPPAEDPPQEQVNNNSGGGVVIPTSASTTTNKLSEKSSVDSENKSETKNDTAKIARDYIKELSTRIVISGCDATDLCANTNFTRADVLKIAMDIYGIKVEKKLKNVFKDISKNSLKDYILTAHKLGIVKGYKDKTFKPNANISRAEALKILFEAPKFAVKSDYTQENNPFTDVKLDDWYAKYALTAYEKGILDRQSDGPVYFYPAQLVTKSEVSKMAILIEELIKNGK